MSQQQKKLAVIRELYPEMADRLQARRDLFPYVRVREDGRLGFTTGFFDLPPQDRQLLRTAFPRVRTRDVGQALRVGQTRRQGVHGFLDWPQVGARNVAIRPPVDTQGQRKARQASLLQVMADVSRRHHLPEFVGRPTVDQIFRYFQALAVPGQHAGAKGKKTMAPTRPLFPVRQLADAIFQMLRNGLVSPSYLITRLRDLDPNDMIYTRDLVIERVETIEDFFAVLPLMEQFADDVSTSGRFVRLLLRQERPIEALFAATDRLVRHPGVLTHVLVRLLGSRLTAELPLGWLLETLRHVGPARRPEILAFMIQTQHVTAENIGALMPLIEENPSERLWALVYDSFFDVPVVRERFFRSFFQDIGNLYSVIIHVLRRIQNGEIVGGDEILAFVRQNLPLDSRMMVYNMFWDLLRPSFRDFDGIDSTFRNALRRRLAHERVTRDGVPVQRVAQQSGMSVQDIEKQIARRNRNMAKN